MISELRYNDDTAEVFCACHVTRANSQQQFVYCLRRLKSKYDTMFLQQHDYFFPRFQERGFAELGSWVASEEEARQQAVQKIVQVYDEFNGWPVYLFHAYLPGETYDGDEQPTPPGQDPRA